MPELFARMTSQLGESAEGETTDGELYLELTRKTVDFSETSNLLNSLYMNILHVQVYGVSVWARIFELSKSVQAIECA